VPVQKTMSIRRSRREEIEKCTVEAETSAESPVVVRDSGGQILRRFLVRTATTRRSVVTSRRHRVYRDIDANFNTRPINIAGSVLPARGGDSRG